MIDDKNFKCPYCKTLLYIIGQERVETLSDHVCDPNGNGSIQDIYACSNTECESNDPEIQIRWDWYGDMYTFGENYKKGKNFSENNAINKNNAPFGTGSRKSNVEIYYRGLKKRLVEVWPKPWTLNLGFLIEYKYKADYDGNVISRKMKLQLLKSSNGVGATHYTPGIISYFQSLTHFQRSKKNFIENMSAFSAKHILEQFEPLSSWDKRLYRILYKWTINTFYLKYKYLAEIFLNKR